MLGNSIFLRKNKFEKIISRCAIWGAGMLYGVFLGEPMSGLSRKSCLRFRIKWGKDVLGKRVRGLVCPVATLQPSASPAYHSSCDHSERHATRQLPYRARATAPLIVATATKQSAFIPPRPLSVDTARIIHYSMLPIYINIFFY